MEKLLMICLLSTLWIAYARADDVLTLNPETPLKNGLSWTFHETSCPDLQSIVRKTVDFYLNKDITQAAGLLRLHFHDCFVQGCDGSILLDGSASDPSEKEAPPNLSLRKETFEIINDIKSWVNKACGNVVSCADLTALAARESVRAAGRPEYLVPLGRKDSLTFASQEVTMANLPSPISNVTTLIAYFASKKLDVTDLVALSGGHTIGIAHCDAFKNRLYPTQDPTLNKSFAKHLYATCPSNTTINSTVLDIRTPNIFDNMYYIDLTKHEGLFTSDQELYTDSRTRDIVDEFAKDKDLFFEKFRWAMIKMGQLSNSGEIRCNCSAPNSASIAEEVADDFTHAEL